MAKQYVMALDAGTTSCRAILFDAQQNIVGLAQREFTQHYPRPGWVEHDPMEIYSCQYGVMTEVLARAGVDAADIAGIGITNQRETTVVWDRKTGRPIFNAIVWQCRRTAPLVERLVKTLPAEVIRQKTGLLPDAYYSATKLRWILDHVEGAQQRAEAGELCFGTVDSWLIYKLTGGKVHVTDATNAARTMLYNIHTLEWDKDILEALNIPAAVLPAVKSSSEVYGTVNLGGVEVPIAGAAGDQQAALFGQTCFAPGDVKNTYGTGCFMLMNTGETAHASKNGLVTTIAVQLNGRTEYALEGSVFVGGAVIQWLRDELGLIRSAPECDRLAESVPTSGGVYVVPAFTGLGAPYWDMYARGTIVGLTRGTTRAHIARAVLDSIAFQVTDLVRAMNDDAPCPLTTLRVDGGASVSDILMQTQADLLRLPVDRPAQVETTAFGAAALAGLAAGVWSGLEELAGLRRSQHVFLPLREEDACAADYRQWRRAVERSRMWIENEL